MRKLFLILVAGLFFTGCGSTVKSTWNDFTAYYNTFYNAKKNFNAGIKKVENQLVTIDPTKPVRIHAPPNQAGNNDFQNAIEKGARVLRKFPDSKWVDDALLLIGKSYYYRQEFYSAIQKFEELQNATSVPEMQSLAIIWKGRTQLDLKEYTSGATFLASELQEYPPEWSTKHKGEIQALAAQHHALSENWNEAANYLFDAVSNIQSKRLKGRTYFLLGQMLERQERYGEAFNAFGEVENNFPDFEYLYWARFKQADIARESRQYEMALDIFQELRNDDKNLDDRSRLLYEIADTYDRMGDPQRAEQLLKNILYDTENSQQSQELKGKVYFKLGEIYSDKYDKYNVAAAYFDSSSTLTNSKSKSEEDAQALADIYGEYTQLQNDISRADSLLMLGGLSEGALDSALARIRLQKQRQLRDVESDQEIALSNTQPQGTETTMNASTLYGFLNHKNAELVDQSKTQFHLRWGERPLADNWRRAEAIRRMDEEDVVSDVEKNRQVSDEDAESVVQMNLDDIPRTEEQKNQLQTDKANAQYKLGNLLLLNLNMPDSARHYFHKVINNDASEKLHPPAMYSLFEIFSSANNSDSLEYWGQTIIDKYPNTRYASRVKSRLEGTTDDDFEQDSTQSLLQQFQQVRNDSTSLKPTKLRKLALDNQSSELAPYIFYESIEIYIQQAKAASSPADLSAIALLKSRQDTMQVTDSVETSSILEEKLRFSGAAWDSVRFAVQQFDTTFPNAQQQKQIAAIKKLLEKDEAEGSAIPTCESLDITLAIESGMDEFLSHVRYPQKVKEMSLSGNVEYFFTVTQDGEMQSYERILQNTKLGIEEAFEEAFDKHLRFEPIQIEKVPDRIKCRVTFPIQH